MEGIIDLHVHSTASDGTCTPAQLVQLAHRAGLCAFALTDHDCTDGIEEALNAAEGSGLEVIPGVELSTEYNGHEIHVVGLYIDRTNAALCRQLKEFRECRDGRNLKMAEKLHEKGFDISAEALYKAFPDCVLTRAHISRYLVNTGQVSSISEVFDKYIGEGCCCYVERMKVSPVEAVRLIHHAKGTAVLAHPCLYRKMSREELMQMITEMKEAGLDAIEALYSCSTPQEEQYFCSVAEQFDLLLSGGSDFHGSNKPDIHLGTGKGSLHVPYSLLEKIKAYRAGR